MQQSIITARPDQSLRKLRLGQREHGAVILHAGLVLRDRAARAAQRGGIVAREIARDRRPGGAAVGGTEHHVRTHIDRVRIMRRVHDRVRPLKAILRVLRIMPHRVERPRIDAARLARATVQHVHAATVVRAEHHVGIDRVAADVARLTARHTVKRGERRRRRRRRTSTKAAATEGRRFTHRAARRTGVLLGATCMIRVVAREMHVIVLTRGHVHRLTRGATVFGDHETVVVRHRDALGIGGVDVDVVIVTATEAAGKCLAAILRHQRTHLRRVHHVGVLRIGVQLGVVPRTLTQIAIATHEGP